ncbi:MAG: hypothetical protein Q9190_000916, partial [Brigantiaea leucoxantha]
MAAQGIRTAILSVSAPGADMFASSSESIALARSCNLYMAQVRDSDPSSFGFFAMIPSPILDMPAALAEIVYAFDELHADGVCLLSRYGTKNYYLGHEEYKPLWSELDNRHAIIFIHPNHQVDTTLVDSSLPQPMLDYPHETCRVAFDLVISDTVRTHPHVKIILSHAGGTMPFLAYRGADMLPTTGLCKNKSSEQIIDELRSFYFDLALGSNELQLPLMRKFAKRGHLLFGSDLPYAPEE